MTQGVLPVLICCYGDFPEISLVNIEKIIQLADNADRLRVFVGANACGSRTLHGLRNLLDARKIEALVESNTNRNKDPMMRVLIEHVDDPYFVWFDDDTFPVQKGWDTQVINFIQSNHSFDVAGFIHVTHRSTYEGYNLFLQRRPWFKSQEVFEKSINQTLEHSAVFPHGAFWIANADFLRRNNFPDRDMIKKADDMLLGELVAQTNGSLKQIGNLWNTYIAVNRAPRRGIGERSDDGWKGMPIQAGGNFDGLTVIPTGGMCNRLRNMITSILLCRENSTPLRLIWEEGSNQIGNACFQDYWKLPSDIAFEQCSTARIMEIHGRETDRGNLYRHPPKAKLRGAYTNHWGLAVVDGESVYKQGLNRLKTGIAHNLVCLNEYWANLVSNYVAKNDLRNCVGFHIRSFEFLYGERTADQIQKVLDNFLSTVKHIRDPIFLATDSQLIQEALMSIQREQCLVWKPIRTKFLHRASKEDFEHGLMDYYLLSNCKKVFGTKGSSFSHMAGIASGDLEWVPGARNTKEWEG